MTAMHASSGGGVAPTIGEGSVPLGGVSDAEITKAFEGTNFGAANHRDLLALSVLKVALKYHCGSTITGIMVRMGLTTERGKVTERGRQFCYDEMNLGRSG